MRGGLRSSCRRFVRGLDLPRVSSVRELFPVVENLSGYPIRTLPISEDIAQGLCGLWIRSQSTDYIFVHPDTSPAHQDHIIAHELGHILRNHQGLPVLPSAPSAKPVADRLVPDLDPRVVKMMLGRTSYEHDDEEEAELIGTYLQRHAHRPGPRRQGDDPVADTLLRERR
ncbi:ImmA/IrrE family metallo-endopeptidase [Kitasatospora sp. GAS1066B]|uniref:ImmA/IrrE family metallo-endopeptidase n=1 Tax=Kitasatospora sp. GAS1066B TaxID=3156271 RepID=UPI003511C478